jgi:hypothetical protein
MSMRTPLSDAITALHQHDDPATYQRFLDIFLQSRLGIIANGLPPLPPGTEYQVRGGSVTCGRTELPEGRIMLLACADLPVFVTRFDRSFNAGGRCCRDDEDRAGGS